jgi:hypothetical protein
MRKIFLRKTGAPYFQASGKIRVSLGKIFQKAGVELSGPFFNAHGGHLQYVANKKDRCFMAVTFVAPLPPASCLMLG